MSRLLLSLLFAVPAWAELPFPPERLACQTSLSEDQFISTSTADLMRVIGFGLDQKILSPRALGLHYLAGTRGRKLTMFISYITKQLTDDATVRAVGRQLLHAEVVYQAELSRIRKDALAFGERHPDLHRPLTTEWRVTVRKLALHALGRNPEGRDSLATALEAYAKIHAKD